MKWITRERPKIDRVACPWLIARFIEADAEFPFVPADQVVPQANALGAIPYDVDAVPLIVIDTYEHAYYVNYQKRKAEYVEKFMTHIDWSEANRRSQGVSL